tara:strand:- start:43 stop:315 length:273 start_codon:yes stop_codon:yes gene_type:complete
MLNKDQIKLMNLLTDAYLFSNNADVTEKDDCPSSLNELPSSYVYEVCSLIEPTMSKIINNTAVYNAFISSGCNVDEINYFFELDSKGELI